MTVVHRECLDGPLQGSTFVLEDGKPTGFFHKREGTGRYLPVGTAGLSFEYWRRCTLNEIKEIHNANEKKRAQGATELP